jgi:hypothetical protein
VASSVTVTGTRGALTCDLVRSILVGAANPGTDALEKVLNPIVEGLQLISRTTRSVGARVCGGVSYPGLAETIEAFYRAVADGGVSPTSPEHLLRVTGVFEELVGHIHAAVKTALRPGADTWVGPYGQGRGAARVSAPWHPTPGPRSRDRRSRLSAEISRALGRPRHRPRRQRTMRTSAHG